MAASMGMSIFAGRKSLFIRYLGILALISVVSGTKHKHFSSKTAYELAHPPPATIIEDDLNSVQVGTYSCLAAHASVILRHGSRYPGLDDIKTILRIHETIKDTLPVQFKELKSWTNSFPDNNDKTLMEMGEEEHFHLGERIAKRLKTLFIDEEIDNFRFLVSSKQRTQESASSFNEGFLEALLAETEEDVETEISDETLRFHERCQKYVHSIDNNKTAIKEFHTFKVGKQMKNVRKKITALLSVPEDLISEADIRVMYLICGYETAMFRTSPWCDLFDKDDIEVLEYLSDLKHYYKNGYGYPIIATQSCPLVTDLFVTMDDAIDAMETEIDEDDMNGYVLGNFLFGHAETLGPLYAALGLFNDSTPLTAENFEQQKNRLFRTSQILPFSANLMMVLYECDQNEELLTEKEAEDESRETTQYMISVFVNEKPVKLPFCDDFTCLYKDVRKHYEHFIECNFSKECEPNNRPKDEL